MAEFTILQYQFGDSVAAASALADRVAADLRAGLAADGCAVLAVSGGRTPGVLFDALSTRSLDWNRVTVTLVDERCVPESSDRSNARLVRAHLLRGQAAMAHFMPLYSVEPDRAEREAQFEQLLRRGFDAVVLGLGLDGHTASFFPDAAEIVHALDLAAAPSILRIASASSQEPRVTFSASALVKTRGLYLQAEGADKAAVITRALADGPTVALPIRVFMRQHLRPFEIFAC